MQNTVFPKAGVPWDELHRVMVDARKDDSNWQDGRMAMASYVVDDELLRVGHDAYGMFLVENALYSGEMARKRKVGFASLTLFQEEILKMALEILNAPEGAGGQITTGGTESVLLAVLGAREWARKNRPDIKQPRILLPRTAHPAFNKGAHYFGLKVTRIPQRADDCKADVAAMEASLADDVIMVVGSAPCYPFGVIDPIRELAAMAAKRGVWFHVDACVGGYVAPFVKKLGYPVTDFDLGVPGVWSVSADLHKYGYAPKNISTLLVRDAALKEYFTFAFDDWPYGSYTTPTVGGSRTGGALAGAWATLKFLGEDGYLKAAKQIMDVRGKLYDGFKSIGGFEVRGAPDIGLVNFGSKAFDIGAVADGMGAKGWAVARAREPAGMHIALNPVHAKAIDQYVSDLGAVVGAVKAGKIAGSGQAAVYAG